MSYPYFLYAQRGWKSNAENRYNEINETNVHRFSIFYNYFCAMKCSSCRVNDI